MRKISMVDFIVATPVYSKFKVNYTSVGHKFLLWNLLWNYCFEAVFKVSCLLQTTNWWYQCNTHAHRIIHSKLFNAASCGKELSCNSIWLQICHHLWCMLIWFSYSHLSFITAWSLLSSMKNVSWIYIWHFLLVLLVVLQLRYTESNLQGL